MIRSCVTFTLFVSSLLVVSGVCAFPNPAVWGNVESSSIDPRTPSTLSDKSNVWVSNGPDGGAISSLIIDPGNPLILFAGTPGAGIYKSVNGGASWVAINNGLEGKTIRCLAIDPHNSSALYAGSDKLYVSTNGGEAWSVLAALFYPNVIVVDPSNTAVLYATTGDGVYKSLDRGANWTRILKSQYGTSGSFTALILDPTHPETIYAGEPANYYDSSGLLHKSTDGGMTWIDTGLRRSISCLAIDPLAPNTVYAGASSYGHHGAQWFPGGFFKSLDGGATWTEITRGSNHLYFSDMRFHPSLQTEFYAVGVAGLLRSVNGGIEWSDLSPDGGNRWRIQALVFDPVTPSTFYAASQAGVLKSVDRGALWAEINTNIRNAYVSAIAVDPSAPDTIYAGELLGGLFVTTNGGETWQTRGTIPITDGYGYTLAVDPASSSTIYAGGTGGLFKSTDGGVTWAPMPSSPPILEFVIDPTDHLTILATSQNGIYKSTDGGGSWTVAMDGLPYTPETVPLYQSWVFFLAPDPTTAHVFYLCVTGGLYKTTDAGSNWARVSDRSGDAFAVDPVQPSLLYLTNGPIIYRSSDGGSHWSPLYQGGAYDVYISLIIHPLTPSVLYALGTSSGISISVDGGTNWRAFNEGLGHTCAYPYRTCLAINPKNPDILYLSSNGGGVYRFNFTNNIVPGPPIRLRASSVGSMITLSWTAPSTGGMPTGYVIDEGWAPGLTDVASFSTGSTATTFGMAGLAGGQYSVRVRATNSAGTSGPSNEVVVVASPALTPTTLHFAGTNIRGTLSPVTGAQPVTVAFSGPTSIRWTAAADQPWVEVTGGSGAGSGTFTVGMINPGNVLGTATSASAIVTVTAAGASNSPQAVAVLLTLQQASANQVPIGAFDTPVNGATGLQGSFAVTGWALDDVGIDRVEIWRDPVAGETTPPYYGPGQPGHGKIFIATPLFITGSRTDVEGLYPTYPFANRAGWGYLLLSQGFWNQGNGSYTLYAFAFDAAGRSTTLGTKTITMSNATATKPFGAIDTPAYGATVSGAFWNFGWALTPNRTPTCTITNGNVLIGIDSRPLVAVNYGDLRADIAAAFPGLSNSNNAGGAYYIDTTLYTNGMHQIGWLVTDNCGRQNGVGSRFFTVLNAGMDAAGRANGDGATWLSPLHAARASMASTEPVSVRQLEGDWERVGPSADGTRVIEVAQDGRIEVQLPPLGSGSYSGTQDVGKGRRELPLGSSLDGKAGIFYWQPAAGFLGKYDLAFESAEAGDVRVRVVVGSPMRAAIDAPSAETAVMQPFTLAGWALDLAADKGTGIDTVHVWAYPATGTAPIFLGVAAYGDRRPDVGRMYGEALADAAYGLSVDMLPLGTYDVVVYPHRARTNTFEGAQVVRVVVK